MSMKSTPWIILMTHGRFGEELKKSVEMITGELENVYCLSLLEGKDPFEYKEELLTLLAQAPDDSIILTDLFGGTPCNTAASIALEKNYTVLSGLNMTMLIEADAMRYDIDENGPAEDIISSAMDGVKIIRKLMQERRK